MMPGSPLSILDDPVHGRGDDVHRSKHKFIWKMLDKTDGRTYI